MSAIDVEKARKSIVSGDVSPLIAAIKDPGIHERDMEALLKLAVDYGHEELAALVAFNMPDGFHSFVEHEAIRKAAQKGMTSVLTAAFVGASKGKGVAGYALYAAAEAGQKGTMAEIAKYYPDFYGWGFDDPASDAMCIAARQGWVEVFEAAVNGVSQGRGLNYYYPRIARQGAARAAWLAADPEEINMGMAGAHKKEADRIFSAADEIGFLVGDTTADFG